MFIKQKNQLLKVQSACKLHRVFFLNKNNYFNYIKHIYLVGCTVPKVTKSDTIVKELKKLLILDPITESCILKR
jgi:hypothetical protein